MRRSVAFLVIAFPLVMFVSGCGSGCSDISPVALTCEHRTNPQGLDERHPRLSWTLTGDERSQRQTAYQILVASSPETLDRDEGDLWDSKKVQSKQTHLISYKGNPLKSGQDCFWKVRAWDKDSLVSLWSKPARWSMGLLDTTDWKAEWIGFDQAWSDSTYKSKAWANGVRLKFAVPYRPLPSPHLRKEFTVQGSITSAKVHVTALGIYELYINGQRVGEDLFMPGWTDYRQRIYYNTYEVASLLKPGQNTITAILGDGWFAGSHLKKGQYYYGHELRLLAQLQLDFDDQNAQYILTDSTWKAAYGPLRESDMQGGETYDSRLEMEGWHQPGFDDSSWHKVVTGKTISGRLYSYPATPVRKQQEVKPVAVFEQSPGVHIVDMGQNFSGWARLTVQGERGDSVVMRFGEALNADSSLHTRNLRSARCTDTYVLKGSGEEVWEPRFTYRGYRYVEVTGYPGQLAADKITGIALYSDLERTGTFECSSELINQLYSNILWSQRSNFVDIPTDCPQRDERTGWAGDAQVFMPTACYNMDAAAFFDKWLVDFVDSRFEDHCFPSMAPRGYGRVAAGWSDAGVIGPWRLFQIYNDTHIIEKNYQPMVQWMECRARFNEEGISTLGSFGDWHNIDSETPIPVISTAYYKRCADLMVEMATIIGKPEDARYYSALADSIFNAYNGHFITDSAQVEGRTQTWYLMSLAYDLLPQPMVEMAVEHLVKDILERDTTLTTGILGAHLLLPVLSQHGETDLAYRLLLSTKYPSWGYPIQNGATTIWERWDGFSYVSGMHEDSTNSLNHYALGSVGEWLYSTIAGIRSDGPGYKKITIAPQPGSQLTFANAKFRSVQGTIGSSWKWEGDLFELEIEIPVNTEATVFIPTDDAGSATERGVRLGKAAGVEILQQTEKAVIVRVGSGRYNFRSPLSHS